MRFSRLPHVAPLPRRSLFALCLAGSALVAASASAQDAIHFSQDAAAFGAVPDGSADVSSTRAAPPQHGGTVHGLLRTFPEKARLVRFEMGIFPEARVNGETIRLAAAARVYDPNNRIVMPASLSGTHQALAETDASGQIARVWILTPEELVAARERARK